MNKEEKAILRDLVEHRGFKLLEQIVEDKRQVLFAEFENIPLGDEKVLERLSQTQNFNKGMKYLINQAKGESQEIIKAPDMS